MHQLGIKPRLKPVKYSWVHAPPDENSEIFISNSDFLEVVIKGLLSLAFGMISLVALYAFFLKLLFSHGESISKVKLEIVFIFPDLTCVLISGFDAYDVQPEHAIAILIIAKPVILMRSI